MTPDQAPAVWPPDVLTLSIDVGGTGLKAAIVDAAGQMITERVKMPTPYPCSPELLVHSLRALTAPFSGYHRVSVGFPGLVRQGKVIEVQAMARAQKGGPLVPELAAPWHGFELAHALAVAYSMPVTVANDADMQGAAVVQGDGLEFVMTLGTGVGTAIFNDGILLPHMELSHIPFKKGATIDVLIGDASRKRMGTKAWIPLVREAIAVFHEELFFDHLYVGGGNAQRLSPEDVGPKGVIVPNSAGILGGVRIWSMTRP